MCLGGNISSEDLKGGSPRKEVVYIYYLEIIHCNPGKKGIYI